MSKYQEMCKAIEEKINGSSRNGSKPACVASAADLTQMTQAMLNSPEHEVTFYAKKVVESDGTPTGIKKYPAKRYRESLKPILRQMGIDKDEVQKIDDLPMSKEHAAALMELATVVQKDYLTAGRRLTYPVTSLNESQMSLCTTTVAERETKPNRFIEQDGKRVPQPTGKTVITRAHTALKARNGVPYWLKDIKDSE